MNRLYIIQLEIDKTTSIGNGSKMYYLESDKTTSRGNGGTMYMGTTKEYCRVAPKIIV